MQRLKGTDNVLFVDSRDIVPLKVSAPLIAGNRSHHPLPSPAQLARQYSRLVLRYQQAVGSVRMAALPVVAQKCPPSVRDTNRKSSH